MGMFGQMFAVQRHYMSYGDLLKIRYSNFPCLVMVGNEDRLVREKNSYMLQRVSLFFLIFALKVTRDFYFRYLAAD